MKEVWEYFFVESQWLSVWNNSCKATVVPLSTCILTLGYFWRLCLCRLLPRRQRIRISFNDILFTVDYYLKEDEWKKSVKELAECLSSGHNDENPPYFVGIAVVSFAPYATLLFSWDYAIIIADKSCLLPWLQIDAWGALKLAFPSPEEFVPCQLLRIQTPFV